MIDRIPGPTQGSAPPLSGQKLYVIADNLPRHKHPGARAWIAVNEVDLVFSATYMCRLSWIEAEFAALRYFALNGTDHHARAEQTDAVAAYIRWRNARAKPKT
jgi:hypothetical protein